MAGQAPRPASPARHVLWSTRTTLSVSQEDQAQAVVEEPSPTSSASNPGSTSTTGLHSAGKAAGLTYFGTETDPGSSEWTDSAYMTILAQAGMFGQLTPGNA